MSQPALPLGKLPADLMSQLLLSVPPANDSVLVGPGPGLDCAVLDLGGDRLLVLKNDPITFTASDLGWYLVQINANDIATTGATPRWLMTTLLYPEAQANERLVRGTFTKLIDACTELGIDLVGGHTEVTQAVHHPIAVGILIGEVERDELLTPRGASPGDVLLLTKFVPIEAVAILCQEMPSVLGKQLSEKELAIGAAFHRRPGVSVLRDAQIARAAGPVSAMHDPTEGGLASALWEFAEASGRRFVIDPKAVPVPPLARRICRLLQIDPLAAISSGALLITAPESSRRQICHALRSQDIPCTAIGKIESGPPGVWTRENDALKLLPRPDRDEIARVFDRPPAL